MDLYMILAKGLYKELMEIYKWHILLYIDMGNRDPIGMTVLARAILLRSVSRTFIKRGTSAFDPSSLSLSSFFSKNTTQVSLEIKELY
jgi:hypothetical protein